MLAGQFVSYKLPSITLVYPMITQKELIIINEEFVEAWAEYVCSSVVENDVDFANARHALDSAFTVFVNEILLRASKKLEANVVLNSMHCWPKLIIKKGKRDV